MKTILETLKAHIEQHPPSYGDAESVLAMHCEQRTKNFRSICCP